MIAQGVGKSCPELLFGRKEQVYKKSGQKIWHLFSLSMKAWFHLFTFLYASLFGQWWYVLVVEQTRLRKDMSMCQFLKAFPLFFRYMSRLVCDLMVSPPYIIQLHVLFFTHTPDKYSLYIENSHNLIVFQVRRIEMTRSNVVSLLLGSD